ncbi:MAG: SDR family oxidoreductase [Verrucomicrobiota bacterium]|nr:SDR family oxidoreductase [Verrucomicrobiota bacterium]
MEKIALVTGGNRGIGLEICRQLAGRGLRVMLAARNQDVGEQAVEKLAKEGKKVEFLELDVSKPETFEKLALDLESKIPKLDILINNAAIFPEPKHTFLDVTQEEILEVFQTNLFGPLFLTRALVPLLKKTDSPRVINLSSGLGSLSEAGGGFAAYRLSKIALNGVTANLDKELKESGILINSMCPGWVKTDMGGPNADRSVDQGADTAVWLALDEPNKTSGKFFRDRKEIDW